LNTRFNALEDFMPDDEGFEVRDKRKVTADGGLAGDAAGAVGGADAPDKAAASSPADTRPLQEVDFISFVGSLAASALMHMGEMITPDQPDDIRDLAAAKQMIDLIDLLKEKTRGNLTDEESKMMETLTYNLKMRFVKESAGGK
jgi:hypothetical protein